MIFELFHILKYIILNLLYILGLIYLFYLTFALDLYQKISDLYKKYDNLYKLIEELKNITHFNNENDKFYTSEFLKIRNELILISRNLKNESISELSSDKESIRSVSEISAKNLKQVLPIQNHIKFPKIFVFNEKNIKQKILADNSIELKFKGNDLRLLSNNLTKFLKLKTGSCLEFNEVYTMVYEYIQDNNIINLSDDNQLCKLFGITENEDYEYTESELISALIKLLEPHLNKVCQGCVILE